MHTLAEIVGSTLRDHRALISFLRIAAVLALLVTGTLEAFNLASSAPADIGIGVISGAALAGLLKASHLA